MATQAQTDATLALQLLQLPSQIASAQGNLDTGGSTTRSFAKKRLKALTNLQNKYGGSAGAQAEAQRLLSDPAVKAAYDQQVAQIAAQNASGGVLTSLGDAVVSAAPTALKAAVLYAAGDLAGGLMSGASGAGGAGVSTQAAAPVSGSWFPVTAGPGVELGAAPAAAVTTSALPAAGAFGAPAVTAGDLAAMGITPGVTTSIPGLTTAAAPTVAGTAGATAGGGLLSDIAGGINSALGTSLTGSQIASGIGAGLNAIGSNMGIGAAQDAQAAANAQNLAAARDAASAMKFKPIGVTTSFSTPNYQYDANGNLVSAGYQLTPQLQAQQTGLLGYADQALADAAAARAATAPMGTAAQSLFGLGQGYIATTPEQAAADWMTNYGALVNPQRAADLSTLENKLIQQGRSGVATGGGVGGMMATNPEMAAYYNAIAQADRQAALEAQQQGRATTQFGTELVGAGGKLLSGMYDVQQGAFQPYTTAMQGATDINTLALQPLSLGMQYGQNVTTGATNAARTLYDASTGATTAMLPYNAYSPTAGLVSGLGNTISGLWGV